MQEGEIQSPSSFPHFGVVQYNSSQYIIHSNIYVVIVSQIVVGIAKVCIIMWQSCINITNKYVVTYSEAIWCIYRSTV